MTFYALALQALLLGAVSAQAVVTGHSSGSACAQLAAQFPSQTFWPGSTQYGIDIARVWSKICVLNATCVFEPASTQDVSAAVRILVSKGTAFSVRGGGHMTVPGANGIQDGVQMSMVRMNSTELLENGAVASLGPGNRWGAVYDWLSGHGMTAAGGRFFDVGVGGLLLGGGVSFFGPEVGWSVNQMRNYEVVLANSSIVNANASGPYSDLFWALKGGSSNFGIVTRFDVQTLPIDGMWGGLVEYVYTKENYAAWLDAVAAYIEPTGGSADPKGMLDHTSLVSPSTGEFVATGGWVSYHGNTTDGGYPASFANFSSLNTSISTVGNHASISAMEQAGYNLPVLSDVSSRQLFWITAMKQKGASVYLSTNIFLNMSFAMLANVPNCTTSINYEIIPQSWVAQARSRGGDAIDLDPADGGLILISIESVWQDAQYDSQIKAFSKAVVAAIDAAAQKAGLYYPFHYINEAGPGQSVYSLYGKGKSLSKMKRIAKKYDPTSVFQTLMPGGFKLSAE